MTTFDERQAELLDTYWSALGKRRTAMAAPDLDPGIATAARRLQELRAVGPDPALALAMRHRFDAQLAALPCQVSRLAPATSVPAASSWWSLSTAAALVLALGISRGLAPAALPSIANAGSVNPAIFTAMPARVGLSVGPTPAPHVASRPSSSVVSPKPGAAFLGVSTVTNTPELDARFGIPSQAGAVVDQVILGGPAARAGLRDKDIITAVDGRPVASAGDLTNTLAQYHPGVRVSLTVARATQTLQLAVTLGSTPK